MSGSLQTRWTRAHDITALVSFVIGGLDVIAFLYFCLVCAATFEMSSPVVGRPQAFETQYRATVAGLALDVAITGLGSLSLLVAIGMWGERAWTRPLALVLGMLACLFAIWIPILDVWLGLAGGSAKSFIYSACLSALYSGTLALIIRRIWPPQAIH